MTADAGIIRSVAKGTRFVAVNVAKGTKFVAVNTAKGAVAVSKVSPYDIGKATVKGVKVAGKAVGKVVY